MARLKSVIAEGFYPTPESVLPRIANLVTPAVTPVPGLDPCAGEGKAMQYLAAQWNLTPYQVEINTRRGAECRKVTPNTLVMDIASVDAANMALVFDNPPYSDREKGVRDELFFIQRMDAALAPGGIHVIVIPDYRLVQTRKIARFLTARYDRLRAWRFPNAEYQSFHQIVLVGIRRKRALQDRLAADYLVDMVQGELPVLPESPLDEPYAIPAPVMPVVFEGNAIDYAAAVEEAASKSWPHLPVNASPKHIGLLAVDGKEAVVDACAHHHGQLVLLSMSGYKTHLKAIKAQLDQREQPLALPTGEAVTEVKGVRYVTCAHPLSQGEHWVILHPRATVEGAQDGQSFYCIDGREPPYETFAEQLKQAVPIPVFGKWAKPLWNLGAQRGLITRVKTARGCRLWQVSADAERWRESLSAALASHQLPLEEVDDPAHFAPAMPFKRGHLLFLLVTNVLPSVVLRDNGKTLVIRGRTVKGIQTEGEAKPGRIVEETTDRKGEIVVVDADTGEITLLTDSKEQIEFVQTWGGQLARIVLERFKPLYNFDLRETLSPKAQTLLDLLATSCQPLPGCAKPGLLESQKHLAVALRRVQHEYGFAILNGEQGSGKTKVSIAAAALAEVESSAGFPLVVSCPEIVSEKWVKELRETWPLIEARIVTSPREMDEFFRQAKLNPGRKWTMVIPNSRLGQGDGWRPVYVRETIVEDDQRRAWTLARYRTDGSALWQQEGHLAIVRRPDGSVIRQIARNVPLAGKQYDVFKCPTCGEIVTYLDKDGHPVVVTDTGWFEKTPQHCIHCGGALYQDDRLMIGAGRKKSNGLGLTVLDQAQDCLRPRVSCTLTEQVQDARGQRHTLHRCPACKDVIVGMVGADTAIPREVEMCGACSQSLWMCTESSSVWIAHSTPRPVRYSLVDYYRRRHRGKAKFYISDEVHLLKGGDTNRGDAFGKLARAVPNVLVMTATLYNGRASSVFYILYRLWAEIRDEFGFTDKMAWIERHGILRRVYRYDDDAIFDSSVQTGLRRRQIGVSELPGLGPELVARFLQCSVFVQLKDIGIRLPPYQELPLDVTLDQDHAKAYEHFHARALAELKENWKLAGAFVQSLFSYSVAPWRVTPLCDPDGVEKACGPDLEIACRHCGRPLMGHKHCLGPRPDEKEHEPGKQGRWKGLRPMAGNAGAETPAEMKPRKGHCHYHGEPLPDECKDGCGVKRARLFAAERKLIETVQHHRRQGEKTLVFVAHTQTWNVIPRLQWAFDQAGIRATPMPKLKPEKRQEWVESFDMNGTDVLIASVNELAEGVDLVAFTVIVFFEVSYVVAKVSQASRRSHRVTQTRPVTVYYLNPFETLASQALEVVLYEMLLDGILRGELPSTDVMNRVANDHATFVEKVARAAIESAGNVDDLAAAFARHNQAMRDTSSDAFLCAVPEPRAVAHRAAMEASPVRIPMPMEAVDGIQIPMLF